jgi:hypothetical protein
VPETPGHDGERDYVAEVHKAQDMAQAEDVLRTMATTLEQSGKFDLAQAMREQASDAGAVEALRHGERQAMIGNHLRSAVAQAVEIVNDPDVVNEPVFGPSPPRYFEERDEFEEALFLCLGADWSRAKSFQPVSEPDRRLVSVPTSFGVWIELSYPRVSSTGHFLWLANERGRSGTTDDWIELPDESGSME